jgi:hypothetical protein
VGDLEERGLQIQGISQPPTGFGEHRCAPASGLGFGARASSPAKCS